jgi:hypothetical protein
VVKGWSWWFSLVIASLELPASGDQQKQQLQQSMTLLTTDEAVDPSFDPSRSEAGRSQTSAPVNGRKQALLHKSSVPLLTLLQTRTSWSMQCPHCLQSHLCSGATWGQRAGISRTNTKRSCGGGGTRKLVAEVDRHNTAEHFVELQGTTKVVHKSTLVRQVLIRGKKLCDRTIRVHSNYSGGRFSSPANATQLQDQPLRSSVPVICRGEPLAVWVTLSGHACFAIIQA